MSRIFVCYHCASLLPIPSRCSSLFRAVFHRSREIWLDPPKWIRLTQRLPILLILCWMVLYLPRPFQLGFYHDDWPLLVEPVHGTAPFSLARLHFFFGPTTVYGSRPLTGLIAFCMSSLFGTSALGFQCVSILLVLLAALSLRSWFNGLLDIFRDYSHTIGDLAAVFWMAMPWMLGATAWPNLALQALISQILFTEAARLLVRHKDLTPKLALQLVAVLVACAFVYEAFYFQIFLLVAFYALSRRGPTRNASQIGWLVALCGFAQAVPIAYNRYSASLGSSTTKQFYPSWAELFWTSVRNLPRVLALSLGEFHSLWAALLCIFAISSLILLSAGLLKKSRRRYCGNLLGLLVLACSAFVVAALTYSIAGYGLASIGIESRVLFTPSFSFAIASFALLSSFFASPARIPKFALLSSAVAVAAVMAFALRNRVDEWAHAWKQESEILSAAPVEQIRRLPASSAIVFVGPSYYKGVVVFDASYDLTSAAFVQSPLNQGKQPFQGRALILPAADDRTLTWDGTTLVWRLPGYWTQRFPAKDVYLWKFGTPGLEKEPAGFRWPPPNSATFVESDSKTQGAWKGIYGTNGFAIANDVAKYPDYAKVMISGSMPPAIWAPSTADVRALQRSLDKGRTAATWWSSSSMSIDIDLTDRNTHRVALYCLDWETNKRAQTIHVLDATSLEVLDSRRVSNFARGQYLVWNLTGHVRIRVSPTGGLNAVVSGLFFDGASPTLREPPASVETGKTPQGIGVDVPAAATFAWIDKRTQGSWRGIYGADGFAIANDATKYPGYAKVTLPPEGGAFAIWAPSTADMRALQGGLEEGRKSATWFSSSGMKFDVDLRDGKAHQVALYCVDWATNERAQTMDVLDAVTGKVLDSRSISKFAGGQYVVWNLSGHTTIRVTRTGGPDAVVSALLFDRASSKPRADQ